MRPPPIPLTGAITDARGIAIVRCHDISIEVSTGRATAGLPIVVLVVRHEGEAPYRLRLTPGPTVVLARALERAVEALDAERAAKPPPQDERPFRPGVPRGRVSP
jgi:hypothetical protein